MIAIWKHRQQAERTMPIEEFFVSPRTDVTRETVLELIGLRFNKLALRYTPYVDPLTATLRARFGEPAAYWDRLEP